MKRTSNIFFLLVIAVFLNNCENYVDSNEMLGLFTNNDLSIKMKILDDNDHTYEMKKISDNELESSYQLDINVRTKFSLSSGEIPIIPGKKYKLSLKFINKGANPLVLYSFWERPKNSLRNYTFCGENGNPPTSKTQEIYSEWKNFEEIFETKENEDFLMIRIYSRKGSFAIGEISIKEVND